MSSVKGSQKRNGFLGVEVVTTNLEKHAGSLLKRYGILGETNKQSTLFLFTRENRRRNEAKEGRELRPKREGGSGVKLGGLIDTPINEHQIGLGTMTEASGRKREQEGGARTGGVRREETQLRINWDEPLTLTLLENGPLAS